MPARVLIAVTHLYGAGHLSRAAALAAGLERAGHAVTLVSGGMPIASATAGARRMVQLPPVRIVGTDYANLLDASGAPVSEEYRARRIAALRAAFDAAAPDAVIVEHFPFGRNQLAPEFLALIDEARARRPRPRILASIRDIMAAPQRPERAIAIGERVRSLFDAVLVHGDEGFLPLDRSWPVARAGIGDKLIYTGYVAAPAADAPAANAPSGGEILVSGGGSAAALPLFRTAIEAAHRDPDGRRWRVLVGHGVPQDRFHDLVGRAEAGTARARLVVERARPDFAALLAACAVSVSQAGYNTVVDLLCARRPAVFVPYEEDDATDQTLRAQALAERGLCAVCPAPELSPTTLLAAIEQAVARGPPAASAIRLDGAARTARIIETLLA